MVKYQGLKLYDRDFEGKLLTCKKIYFQKKWSDNRYFVFCCEGGIDSEKSDDDPHNYPLWSIWSDEALFDCIWDYYTANPGEDGVVIHEQNTGVDSDGKDE